MTRLKRRAVGARGTRGGLAAMAVVALAGSVQGADIRSEIETLGADWYWPMEYGLFSEREYGSYGRVYFGVQEENGATVRHANHGSARPIEYLPMLPAHMTLAPTSPALIFNETTGVLTSAERSLYATSSQFNSGSGSVAPLSAMGMFGNQNPWTVHVIVGSDADDGDERGEETVFYFGPDADMSPYPAEPNIMKLTVDRTSTGTTYTLTRTAQGNTYSASVPIAHPVGYTAGDRQWHQVFAEHTGTAGSKIKLSVREAGGALSTDVDLGSNWLFATDSTEFFLGAQNDIQGIADAKRFHGAMHHFAVWRSGLTTTEKDDLGTAWTTAPTARDDHEIDWGADLRFFVWTVPVKDRVTALGVPSAPADRDLLSWADPLWDHDLVYPFVRFFADYPDYLYSPWKPPATHGLTLLDQNGRTPEHLANQAFNWINYMAINLAAHTDGANSSPSRTTAKSIGDGTGVGYTMFMQNWGGELSAHTAPSIYLDRGASRALVTNWRDMSADWRVSDTNHLSLAFGTSLHEGEVPYHREGMSINAARTSEVFMRLGGLLADAGLPAPGRLHLDHEIVDIGDRVFTSVADPGLNPNPYGWWHAALGEADFMTTPESRVDDPAHFSGFGNTLDDFRDSLGTYNPSATIFSSVNSAFRSAYRSFAFREYEHALKNALLRPAYEFLNPDIRSSEYGITQSSSYTVNELDFSSHIVYPRKGSDLTGDVDRSGTTINHVYLGYLFDTPELMDHEAEYTGDLHEAAAGTVKEVLDNIYVERWKVSLSKCYVASGSETGKPQAPWLPIPGWSRSLSATFDSTSVALFDNLPRYEIDWEEVARLAVFAHRRGVSEFLFWCDDRTVSYTGEMLDPSQSEVNANVAGFESIIQAVEYAKASRWDVTTCGALDRTDDLFGIPDGILTVDDYFYLMARAVNGDLEGDVTGANAGFPDGVVDNEEITGLDILYIENEFPYSNLVTCP